MSQRSREPCFDKLKADLGKAILSIGACVGFTFGEGESLAKMTGKEASQNIDNFGGIEVLVTVEKYGSLFLLSLLCNWG